MSLEETRSPRLGTYPWQSDQENGMFLNPVICADYSDPDVIRHGGDFYLIASSFQCTPALPILHSHDLVNWTIINHAVKNLPSPRYAQVQSGQGVWAPALRFHDGKFWIFFPMPEEGIYMITAQHPAGQWSEPHLVQAGYGLIDPCPLWDDDGQAYLIYAYACSRAGIKDKLRICPMSPDGTRLLGDGQIVFDDPERHPTIEGPKFLKRDGWYYILAPAGGVATGWQVALRSRQIYGPYEDRIVLEQGAIQPTNGPHQGALVDLPNGEWWFLHFQDAGIYGRITHVQPVEWVDGWPMMGVDFDGNHVGEPVLKFRKPGVAGQFPIATPATTDEFDASALGLQWQWYANHRDDWYSLTERPHYLRLFSQIASEDFGQVPHLLLQKFPARAFVVETALEFSPQEIGEQAGLIVMGGVHASLGLQRHANGLRIVVHINNQETSAEFVPSYSVRLRVIVADGGLCQFSYTLFDQNEFRLVGEPFQAGEGHWIGAKVGIYSLSRLSNLPSGHADFDYFRFTAD